MKSIVTDLVPLMNNYRSLLYYGQLDLLDPYTASVNFIQVSYFKNFLVAEFQFCRQRA